MSEGMESTVCIVLQLELLPLSSLWGRDHTEHRKLTPVTSRRLNSHAFVRQTSKRKQMSQPLSLALF